MKVLKKRSQFVAVSKARNITRLPHVWVQTYYAKGQKNEPDNRADGFPSVGFTASRKVGSAIKRNRAKRRLRAIFRHFLKTEKMDKFKDFHFVLIALPSTVTGDFNALYDDVLTGMHKGVSRFHYHQKHPRQENA